MQKLRRRRDVTAGELKKRIAMSCELLSHKDLQTFVYFEKGKRGKGPSFDPKSKKKEKRRMG